MKGKIDHWITGAIMFSKIKNFENLSKSTFFLYTMQKHKQGNAKKSKNDRLIFRNRVCIPLSALDNTVNAGRCAVLIFVVTL
jgi:hypothetical protein